MGDTITVEATLTFKLAKGEPLDAETVFDFFAGTFGRQNAATTPLKFLVYDGSGEKESTYELELVEEGGG